MEDFWRIAGIQNSLMLLYLLMYIYCDFSTKAAGLGSTWERMVAKFREAPHHFSTFSQLTLTPS
jgi:hypothetical protein